MNVVFRSVQSCGPAPHASSHRGAGGVDRLDQYTRRNAALYRTVFCGSGNNGLACSQLRGRAGALRHETVIASHGVYTSGTDHFAHADKPADEARAADYASGSTHALSEQAQQADLASVPANSDPANVARAIARIVAISSGTRPFWITIDPADGGAEELGKLSDRVRAAFLRDAGMGDLLQLLSR